MNNMITLLLTGWGLTVLILLAWIIKFKLKNPTKKKKDNRKILKD
jgi:hypothetical protein